MKLPHDEGKRLGLDVSTLYGETLLELESVLSKIGGIPPRVNWREPRDHLKYATCLFGFGILTSGLAILTLYRAGIHRHLPLMLRSQFEATIKAEYLASDPRRAVDFFDSEPFERWALARDFPVDSESLTQIESACLDVVRRRPSLLRDPHDLTGVLENSKTIDYKYVWQRLKFKDLASMIRELRANGSDITMGHYVILHRSGSLEVHNSIIALREAFCNYKEDGSMEFSVNGQQSDAAEAYLLQSAQIIIGTTAQLSERLGLRHAVETRLGDLYTRKEGLIKELETLDGLNL